MNNLKVLTNGIFKENPTFALLLGMCPTLGVTTSAINGMGMGLGFTLSLTLLGTIREILGSGKAFNFPIFNENYGMLIFVLAPGAFLALGYLIAIVNRIRKTN